MKKVKVDQLNGLIPQLEIEKRKMIKDLKGKFLIFLLLNINKKELFRKKWSFIVLVFIS